MGIPPPSLTTALPQCDDTIIHLSSMVLLFGTQVHAFRGQLTDVFMTPILDAERLVFSWSGGVILLSSLNETPVSCCCCMSDLLARSEMCLPQQLVTACLALHPG